MAAFIMSTKLTYLAEQFWEEIKYVITSFFYSFKHPSLIED